MCALVVDRRSAEAPVRNLSKASVKFSAALGPHVKLPTEMSNFPTLGGPPGANVKLSKGSVKVYAGLGPYYPPHTCTRIPNPRFHRIHDIHCLTCKDARLSFISSPFHRT